MVATGEYWQEVRQVVIDDNRTWAALFFEAGLHPDAELEVRPLPPPSRHSLVGVRARGRASAWG
eukprot:3267731-Prymnesium_polylepis.1